MPTVSTRLYYAAPLEDAGTREGWVIDAVSRPPEILTNFRKVPVDVEIADLREVDVRPTLDDAGFERVARPTRVDQRELAARAEPAIAAYQQETCALLQARTGADDVVIFDATWRSEDPDAVPGGPNQSAHLRVHVDQNPASARARAAHHAGPASTKPSRPFHRFQIVNVWRPLLAPVRNYPLALCDYRTVDVAADLVTTRLCFPAWLKDGENYSVTFNARHRWYHWAALTPDEALIFKCYDSASRTLALASDGAERPGLLDVAGLCPHTAFFNPGGPSHGRLRTSLELRALVLYR